jgi:hypothetical protein
MFRLGKKRTLASRVTDALRPGYELTFNQLVEKVEPFSVSEFGRILDELTAKNQIVQVIRVESPSRNNL